MSEFEYKHQDNMQYYKDNKDINEEFQQQLNKTLKFDQYLAKKKNPYNGENARRDNAFRDIILEYKDKGYKIPDLSVRKNLFKTSALLIDNCNLKQYFNTRKDGENSNTFEDKEIFFISKVNNLIYDRLKDLDKRVDPSKYKNLEKFQMSNVGIGKFIQKDEFSDKKFKDLRKSTMITKVENDKIKERLRKLEEENEALNESDTNLNIKSIHPQKKKQKVRPSYNEFIKRLSKPKYERGVTVEVRKSNPEDIMERLKNRFNMPNQESLKPYPQMGVKPSFNAFINEIKMKTNKTKNSIIQSIMRNTMSTNFESVNFFLIFEKE